MLSRIWTNVTLRADTADGRERHGVQIHHGVSFMTDPSVMHCSWCHLKHRQQRIMSPLLVRPTLHWEWQCKLSTGESGPWASAAAWSTLPCGWVVTSVGIVAITSEASAPGCCASCDIEAAEVDSSAAGGNPDVQPDADAALPADRKAERVLRCWCSASKVLTRCASHTSHKASSPCRIMVDGQSLRHRSHTPIVATKS